MSTLDRLLNRLLTRLRGPRCYYCQHRPGRSDFDQAGHMWRSHANIGWPA